MYLVHTPNYVQALFPGLTWKMPGHEANLYLTFDDGPIPEVTPWVLKTLDEFDAKASFFCVGDNVQKNPGLFQEVARHGHAIGNHTHNHLSGWSTPNLTYFNNIRHCARLVNSGLFRPPYGKLKPSQVQFLQRHYAIIMWDVLSGDFDRDLTPKEVARNVIQHSGPGSIVVFHDSLKAEAKLKYALPRVLDHFAGLGYSFRPLPVLAADRAERKLCMAV